MHAKVTVYVCPLLVSYRNDVSDVLNADSGRYADTLTHLRRVEGRGSWHVRRRRGSTERRREVHLARWW